MDVLLNVATDEISLEGSRGCTLPMLWELLEARLPLSGITCLPPPLKQQLWQLLKAPSTPFMFAVGSILDDAAAAPAHQRQPAAPAAPPGRKRGGGKKRKKGEDPDFDEEVEEGGEGEDPGRGPAASKNQAVMVAMAPDLTPVPLELVPEDMGAASSLGYVVVASIPLRLRALRVDDLMISLHKMNSTMMSVLEMLGQARERGQVQIDMCKALNMAPRNFFYVLRNLEMRQLVVRHKLLVPFVNKGSSTAPQGWNFTSIVHHMRFVPPFEFGPHVVFQEVQTADGRMLQPGRGTHAVRDDAASLRQVCDLINATNEKAVVEMQLKQVLGYSQTAGHRAWRRLKNKLVRLGYIEVVPADVLGKPRMVVQLLRSYRGGPLCTAAQEARLLARRAAMTTGQVGSEDEEEPEPSDADEGGEAVKEEEGDGEAEADGEEEGGEGGGGAAKAEWDAQSVEMSFTRTVLNLVCGAGSEGLLTTQLAQMVNMRMKSFLRRIHDMVKRYGLQVTYDVKGRAITNRITAPPDLLAIWHAHNPPAAGALAAAAALPGPAAAAGDAAGAGAAGLVPGTAAAPAAAAGGGATGQQLVDGSTPNGRQQQLVDGSTPNGRQQLLVDGSTPNGRQQQLLGSTAVLPGLPMGGPAAAATPGAAGGGGGGGGGGGPGPMDLDALAAAIAADGSEEEDVALLQVQGVEAAPPTEAAAGAGAGAAGGGGDGAGGKLALGPWVPITLVAQQRLQVLHQHLMQNGYLLKREVRRVLRQASTSTTRLQGTSSSGVDLKTTQRLMTHLEQLTRARKVVVTASTALGPSGAAQTRTRTEMIEAWVLPNLELTQELLNDIANHNRNLARLTMQDHSRMLKESRDKIKEASGKTTVAVALLAPLQGRLAGASGEGPPSRRPEQRPARRRRARKERRRAPGDGVADDVSSGEEGAGGRGGSRQPAGSDDEWLPEVDEAAAAEAGGSGEEGGGAAEPAVEAGGGEVEGAQLWAGVLPVRRLPGGGVYVSYPGTLPPGSTAVTVQETLRQQEERRRKDRHVQHARVVQLGMNGYQKSRLVRGRLLHDYLCQVTGLGGYPPFTPPQLQHQHPPQAATAAAGDDDDGSPVDGATAAAGGGGMAPMGLPERPMLAAGGQHVVVQVGLAGAVEAFQPVAFTLQRSVHVGGDAAGDGGDGMEEEGGVVHRVAVPQQPGVELGLWDLWSWMPLELALQVAGTYNDAGAALLAAVEGQRLVGQLSPEEYKLLFDGQHWSRLQTALNILARLGLLSAINAQIILVHSCMTAELPRLPPRAPVTRQYQLGGPTGGQQLTQYWKDLQESFLNKLLPPSLKSSCFPGGQVPEISREKSWKDENEGLPLLGYLRLQQQLAGVSLAAMDWVLAQQLATRLGLDYPKVLKLVTYRRAQANYSRVRQGKKPIPIITPEGRRARRPLRRPKRKRGRPSEAVGGGGGASADEADTSGATTSGGSDASDEEVRAYQRLDKRARRAGICARSVPVVVLAALPPGSPGSPAGAAAEAAGGAAGGAGGAAAAGGAGTPGGGEGGGQRSEEAALLAALDQQVDAGDLGRLADVNTLEQYGTLYPPGAEEEAGGAGPRGQPPGLEDGASGGPVSDDEGAMGGEAALPVRVTRRRLTWRPGMDQQLLRVLVLFLVELGSKAKPFWRRLTGLPAPMSFCHRRYQLLQRKVPELLQELEEGAAKVHQKMAERRRQLQQRLYELPAARAWTRRPTQVVPTANIRRALLAHHVQRVQQEVGEGRAGEEAQQLAAEGAGAGGGAEEGEGRSPATAEAVGSSAAAAAAAAQEAAAGEGTEGEGDGLVPALNEALATMDAVLEAGALHKVAGGPVLITPAGNVVLLPNESERAELEALLSLTRQVQQTMVYKKEPRKKQGHHRQMLQGRGASGPRRRRGAAAVRSKAVRRLDMALDQLQQLYGSEEGGQEAGEGVWEGGAPMAALGTAWGPLSQLPAAAAGGGGGRGGPGGAAAAAAAQLAALAVEGLVAAWQQAAAGGALLGRGAGSAPGAALAGAAAAAAAADASSAAGQQAAAAAAAAASQEGPRTLSSGGDMLAGPLLPVTKAAELIVTLLYVTQRKGAAAGWSAAALTSRFSDQTIVAAFKWLRQLNWINPIACRRPLVLSKAWWRQLQGDSALTWLLLGGSKAQEALEQQLGLAAAAGDAGGAEHTHQQQQQQGSAAGVPGARMLVPHPSGAGHAVQDVGQGPLLLQLLWRGFQGQLKLVLLPGRAPEEREGPLLLGAVQQPLEVLAAAPGPADLAAAVVVGAGQEEVAAGNDLLAYTAETRAATAALAAAAGGAAGGDLGLVAAGPLDQGGSGEPGLMTLLAAAIDHPTPPAAATTAATGFTPYAVGSDESVRAAAEARCWEGLPAAGGGGVSAALAQQLLSRTRAAGEAGVSQQQLVQQCQQALAAAGTWAPLQDAAAAVAAAMQQLHRYGLVRVVQGWRGAMWVASEASQVLLAYPTPPSQPPAAANTPAATAAGGGGQLPASSAVPPVGEQQPQPQQQQVVLGGGGAGEVVLAPWLDPAGQLVPELWCGLVARALGAVMRNPGIPEPLLLAQLGSLSPGSAAQLLGALTSQQVLLVKGLKVTSAPAAAVAAAAAVVGPAGAPPGAAPPSLLRQRRRAAAAAAGVGEGEGQLVEVRHYWCSIGSSWTAPATVQPPAVVVSVEAAELAMAGDPMLVV